MPVETETLSVRLIMHVELEVAVEVFVPKSWLCWEALSDLEESAYKVILKS